MGRPRYKILDEDLKLIRRWIDGQFTTFSFPSADPERNRLAREAYRQLGGEVDSASLNQWAEAWMRSAHWKRMKNAIRAGRKRTGDRYTERRKRGIDLTTEAWHYLSRIAEHEGITLSEVITKHLRPQYVKVLSEDEDKAQVSLHELVG